VTRSGSFSTGGTASDGTWSGAMCRIGVAGIAETCRASRTISGRVSTCWSARITGCQETDRSPTIHPDGNLVQARWLRFPAGHFFEMGELESDDSSRLTRGQPRGRCRSISCAVTSPWEAFHVGSPR